MIKIFPFVQTLAQKVLIKMETIIFVMIVM